MSTAQNVFSAIGNTPLLRLQHIVPSDAAEVYVKYEGGNPTGSYKDRMALGVITQAMADGVLRRGDHLCEYTGGSTGAALAMVCAVLGLRFTAVSSDAFAPSKLQAMRAYGAELILEPSADGTLTPELFQRMKARVRQLVDERGSHYFDQFGSPAIRPSYARLGMEIVDQLDGPVDAFCAAVGTGGALMGTMDGLVARGCTPAVYAIEPLQSPTLTTGQGGKHSVEGIALGFAPPFLDRTAITGARAVDQESGFAMCRRLAVEEGILAGGSTGLNVVAALELARELGPGKRVVTLGCDTGIKYLGGPIYTGGPSAARVAPC